MTPYYADPWLTIYAGDCRTVLAELPDESVHCVVTSPPYWGLRDYGNDGQLGLEPTPEQYVANMVAVFREVRRVLRRDGTLWLNLGDSYANDFKHGGMSDKTGLRPFPTKYGKAIDEDAKGTRRVQHQAVAEAGRYAGPNGPQHSPYGQGFTRRSAAWAERKANGATPGSHGVGQLVGSGTQRTVHGDGMTNELGDALTRNLRSVWTIATRPYPGAHFAVFPPELPERCIKAGCPEGGTVLDPFAGSGTVGMVAAKLSRRAILIDLNSGYIKQQLIRNHQVPLGLTEPVA